MTLARLCKCSCSWRRPSSCRTLSNSVGSASSSPRDRRTTRLEHRLGKYNDIKSDATIRMKPPDASKDTPESKQALSLSAMCSVCDIKKWVVSEICVEGLFGQRCLGKALFVVRHFEDFEYRFLHHGAL